MKNPNHLLLGSVVFILLAVALVAILDKSSSNNNANDVRARAATVQALALTGTVSAVDATKGTVSVDNVAFANSTGTPQNLGSWVVTAPGGFNFALVSAGSKVTIGVDASSFQVTSHTMTALTLVPAK